MATGYSFADGRAAAVSYLVGGASVNFDAGNKSLNDGFFINSSWGGGYLARAGTNTVWFEIGGVGLTYQDTANGLASTGGSITSLTIRDDAGRIIASVTGFAPIDAANFFNVMAGTNSTAAYELLSNLGDGDTVISGSDVANGVVAGTGNDVATMLGGDDLVVKFDPGNLTYNGGTGSDTLSFKAELGDSFPTPFIQPLIVDLGAGTGQNPYGGTLSLTSVENVIGTPNPDTITGSDAANIIGDAITETAGDVINALGGDDIVGFFSFAGFIPSLPGATVDGGTGTDTLVFQYDQEGNVLDLANQAANAGMFRASTFSNFERFVVGSDFSTSFGSLDFRGDGTANDLEVRQGRLTIDLRGGDDVLRLASTSTTDPVTADGGAGNDRLIFTPTFAVNVLDLANPANNTFPFANGTFTNFETFEMAATPPSVAALNFQLDFRGDGTASTVIGGDDGDTFRGAGGNDTLRGGGGGDLYIFAAGDGNDTITDIGLARDTGQAGSNETDILRLAGLNPADVALTRAGNDLMVTLNGTGEIIRVTDHFLGGARGLEQIEFTGVTFSRQAIIDNLVGGTPNASPTVGSVIVNAGTEDSGVQVIDLLAGAADANGNTLHVANVNGLGPGMTIVGDTLRVDRSDPGYQSFHGGGNPNFQVTYDIVDGQGGSVGQRATVTVTGVNDAAVIGGETTGSVTENGTLGAWGFLTISDVDVNTINGLSEARFQTQASVVTAYGTFALVHPSGVWTYTLDNANPTVQALNAGQTLTDTIQVRAIDGTTANVVITVNGAGGGSGDPPATGDYTGDGMSDILLHNGNSGLIWEFQMNGTAVAAQGGVTTVGSGWAVEGVGDFDGDGRADIVLHNINMGLIWEYQMNGTVVVGQGAVTTVGTGWAIEGIGDFNGDARADILLHNISTGMIWEYQMNGTAVTAQGGVTTVGSGWAVEGVGDFNGDGRDDILLHNSSTGMIWQYQMNGTAVTAQGSVAIVGSGWTIAGVGDFNDDGHDDILLHNSSTGMIWQYQMSGTAISGQGHVATPGLDWRISGTGDFNGDGRDDIVLHNSNTGLVWEYQMNGLVVSSQGAVTTLGSDWHIV